MAEVYTVRGTCFRTFRQSIPQHNAFEARSRLTMLRSYNRPCNVLAAYSAQNTTKNKTEVHLALKYK